MKKILLAVLAVLVFAAPAFADWSVTVTWTRSVGPNLDFERVLWNGDQKCDVAATETTSCNFILPELGGEVVIRSYNTQGAYSQAGPITIDGVPVPATNVNVTVTYVAP
jgi:hypothetical protein